MASDDELPQREQAVQKYLSDGDLPYVLSVLEQLLAMQSSLATSRGIAFTKWSVVCRCGNGRWVEAVGPSLV